MAVASSCFTSGSQTYQLELEQGAGGLEQLEDGTEVLAVVAEELVAVVQDLELVFGLSYEKILSPKLKKG